MSEVVKPKSEPKKAAEALVLKVRKFIFKKRTDDEQLELALYAALFCLFIGCWLTAHIGVSFIVLGVVLLAIVHKATQMRKEE